MIYVECRDIRQTRSTSINRNKEYEKLTYEITY